MYNTALGYKVHWELTDRCNLKCPMCPRTDRFDRCRPAKTVRNLQFFLKDVKKYIGDDVLRKLKRVDFCGNLGDPCAAQDFYEICEFLVQHYHITIMASTNGSLRDPSWWCKLGRLFAGTDSWIEFHIDGLRDTNHLYRIGASWEKIMANVRAFLTAGARADWLYILFKHNQHQLETAHEMARRMGFRHFVPVDTGRFSPDGRFEYMHPDGDMRLLEQATITVRPEIETIRLPGMPAGPQADVRGMACKAFHQNRFYLDVSGYIAPCCWISNCDIQRPGDMLRALSLSNRDLNHFNIRNRPLEAILQDELFTKVFSALWQKNALVTCRKKCGQNHKNYKARIKL